MEYLLLIVLGRQEFDTHKALVRLILRYLLFHVGVGFFQLTGLGFVDFLQRQVFETGGLSEEGVVERDDTSLGTVVGAERKGFRLSGIKLTLDIIEQSPVTSTPAVDALFHVAHDEVLTVHMTHRLVE